MALIKIAWTFRDEEMRPCEDGHFDPGFVDETLFQQYLRAEKRFEKIITKLRKQSEENPA